jgi:hypothetical protein
MLEERFATERTVPKKVHSFRSNQSFCGGSMEYLTRFLIGGVVVSTFAVLGDVLRPKSFAGLFGAAPSIARATLGLTLWKEGASYIELEGRSMILGGLALALYCLVVCQLLMRLRWSALAASTTAILLWLALALGSEQLILG